MGGNEEYNYTFYTHTLNSLSVTDTIQLRKQTNITVTTSFIVAIVTVEQRQVPYTYLEFPVSDGYDTAQETDEYRCY